MYKNKNKSLAIYLVLCFLFTVFTNSIFVYAVDANESIDSKEEEPLAVIKEKLVLSANDVPEVIDFAQAKEKGHVLRMREKEDDDYTVVFLSLSIVT